MPLSWAGVLTWGGLRGGPSMVLVLGLPAEMAHRDLLVAMTFGVVILSILLQGLTMGPLLRRLGLVASREGCGEYDRLRGQPKASRAALTEFNRMVTEGALAREIADELRGAYARRVEETEAAMTSLHLHAEDLREAERRAALRRATTAEKDAILTARRSGQISDESYEQLLTDVDARLFESREEH